jgi:hypothetical protein
MRYAMGLRGGGSARKSYFFMSLQTQKGTRFSMCFSPHFGLFFFFHFPFMLGKAQGPRNYQNKGP